MSLPPGWCTGTTDCPAPVHAPGCFAALPPVAGERHAIRYAADPVTHQALAAAVAGVIDETDRVVADALKIGTPDLHAALAAVYRRAVERLTTVGERDAA